MKWMKLDSQMKLSQKPKINMVKRMMEQGNQVRKGGGKRSDRMREIGEGKGIESGMTEKGRRKPRKRKSRQKIGKQD